MNKTNSYILSTKKLQDLRSKLFSSENNPCFSSNFKTHSDKYVEKRDNNFKPKESTYKQMLNRVREKSQEQASQVQTIDNTIKDKNESRLQLITNKQNKNINEKSLVSPNSNNFQIVSNDSFRYDDNFEKQNKSNNNLENSHKQFDFEDEQLISILNTNNYTKSDYGNLRKIQELKKSSIEYKSDFYEENLFDLIDEIESKESFSQTRENSSSSNEKFADFGKNEKIIIDYEIDKMY